MRKCVFINDCEYDINIKWQYICTYISFMISGSVDGGVDIVDKENVGVTNRVSFHGLKLQNGHKYYVTVTGMYYISWKLIINNNGAMPITLQDNGHIIIGHVNFYFLCEIVCKILQRATQA